MSDEPKKTPKRMGRPPKSPEKGRRQNYTFRMSDADRDRIVKAAGGSGRSLSEEIEQRLVLYAQVEDEFGSGSRLDLLRLMAVTLKFTERLTATSDYDSREFLIESAESIKTMLDQLVRTKGPVSHQQALADALGETGSTGKAAALALSATFDIPEESLSERDRAERHAALARVAEIKATGRPGGAEGDRQVLDEDLAAAANREGVSQEELRTSLRAKSASRKKA